MNIYSLHSNPEELHGFDRAPYKIPELAYKLAKENPELRPKLELAIMKDPQFAADYAVFIIGRRWPEAEPYIMGNAFLSYYYAAKVLKRRWPEAEPHIMKDADAAYLYARDILERRWPEAEPIILKDKVWGRLYINIFKIKQDKI